MPITNCYITQIYNIETCTAWKECKNNYNNVKYLGYMICYQINMLGLCFSINFNPQYSYLAKLIYYFQNLNKCITDTKVGKISYNYDKTCFYSMEKKILIISSKHYILKWFIGLGHANRFIHLYLVCSFIFFYLTVYPAAP